MKRLLLAALCLFPVVAFAGGASFPPGLLPGGDGSSLKITPTGGTAARTPAAIAGQEINVLNYTGVDPTGATDSSAGIQAAINYACTFSPAKAVYFPPGKYDILATLTDIGTCPGLVLYGVQGSSTLIADAANVNTTLIFRTIRQTGVTISGLTFDGNASAQTTTSALLTVSAPSSAVTIENSTFQNAKGTAITAGGSTALTATLASQATAGSSTLTLTSVPAGLVAGAYFYGTWIDPDIYVAGISGTTLTLSKPLTDTLFSGTSIHLTNSFPTSADTGGGTTVIPVSDTTHIATGMTVFYDGSCLTSNAHIASISANTSVTLDQATLCAIPSGTSIAAGFGIQDLQVLRNKFDSLGMAQRTAGTLTVTTNGDTASGASSVTFNCRAAACVQVGLIPGNLAALTGAPAGMPAGDLVTGGPIVNNGASTFTVSFASPMTAGIPSGTAIPFSINATAGAGYALWAANGATLANQNYNISGNFFRHTFSSPLFLQNIKNLTLRGNTYTLDFMETQRPDIAPSACIAPSFTINMTVVGDICSGATGMGIEADHNIGTVLSGVNFSGNGRGGAYFCGGHDIKIDGTFGNNGQYLNLPLTQQFSTPDNGGVVLDGSCTGNLAGTISNVSIGPINASDYQTTPTQAWAVARGRTQGSVSGLNIGSVNAVGNTSGVIGFVPVLSAAGTGASLDASATDAQGLITEGTSATGAVLTFAAPKTAAPHCTVSSPNGASVTGVSVSTTALTITNASASGNEYAYACAP